MIPQLHIPGSKWNKNRSTHAKRGLYARVSSGALQQISVTHSTKAGTHNWRVSTLPTVTQPASKFWNTWTHNGVHSTSMQRRTYALPTMQSGTANSISQPLASTLMRTKFASNVLASQSPTKTSSNFILSKCMPWTTLTRMKWQSGRTSLKPTKTISAMQRSKRAAPATMPTSGPKVLDSTYWYYLAGKIVLENLRVRYLETRKVFR